MWATGWRDVLVVLLAMETASLVAVAQPMQRQQTIPDLGVFFYLDFSSSSAALAQDPVGNVYVGTHGAVFGSAAHRIDAAGVLRGTAEVPGFMLCLPTCGKGLVGIASDASGAYIAGNTSRGPMRCPIGCG